MFNKDHTIAFDGKIYTCPACAWRAVLATDGRIIQTDMGQPGHNHLGQARDHRDTDAAQRRAYAEHVAAGLPHRWQEETAGHTAPLWQLRRLKELIEAEYMP